MRRGALLTEQRISRSVALKNPALTFARVLCVDEPIPASVDEPELEPAPSRWPDRNRRQCVYLASIRAAGARGVVGADDSGDSAGVADDSQDAAPGDVIRLGRVGTAMGRTSAAFYATPTAKFAHSARHNLTTVEAARVQKSKEELKIAELEGARDAKAAKAAGVKLHVPSGEDAAGLAALRVVQKTEAIETAPRLARLEDLLTSWPLLHGLYPPAPTDQTHTSPESRFILASGVPEPVSTAEMQAVCAGAFASVVSCEPWPSEPRKVCIGLWSAARASRALKTSLTVHGQPVTLTACPSQDVPSTFELSGLGSLAAPGGEGDGTESNDSDADSYLEYCENCGEEQYNPDEHTCYACGYHQEDY
eukprot:COSAG02_NODE_6447_length_3564_cov_1.635786_3_plen_364_part_00